MTINDLQARILSDFDECEDPVCAYDAKDRVIYTNAAHRALFPFIDWDRDLTFHDVFVAVLAQGGGQSLSARENPDVASKSAQDWRRRYPNNDFVRHHLDGTRWQVTERELLPGLHVQVRRQLADRMDMPPTDGDAGTQRFSEAWPNFDPIECFRWLDYLRRAFEGMSEPIGIVGEQARLVHCNEPFAKVLEDERALALDAGNRIIFADKTTGDLLTELLTCAAQADFEEERLRPLRDWTGRTLGFIRMTALAQDSDLSRQGPAAVILTLTGGR